MLHNHACEDRTHVRPNWFWRFCLSALEQSRAIQHAARPFGRAERLGQGLLRVESSAPMYAIRNDGSSVAHTLAIDDSTRCVGALALHSSH